MDCAFFHPKLCHASVRKECCVKEKECRFFHLKLFRSNNKNTKSKEEDSEKEMRQKIENEVKERVEKEMKEKSVKDKQGSARNDNKKEQDFQKAQDPDLMKILKVLQEQVSELAAAEKMRKNQEQMYYQNWFPMQYQNSQQ